MPASMPDGNIIMGSRLETFRANGWRGRVDHQWRHLVHGDPLDWVADHSPQAVWERPSATTYRVQTEVGVVYAKHMTARKDRLRAAADWPSRLRWRLQPSLALRVMRIHRQLARSGFLVAPVLLAARRVRGWRAEVLLVTGEVSGPSVHHAVVDAPDDRIRSELIRMVGRRVAELHRLRFNHGDLLPGNLLVTADRADVVWLDNDRSRRWFPVVPPSARRRNLAQFTYRFISWFRYRWTRLFLESYYDARGVSRDARRWESALVLRRARARLRTVCVGSGRQLPRLC